MKRGFIKRNGLLLALLLTPTAWLGSDGRAQGAQVKAAPLPSRGADELDAELTRLASNKLYSGVVLVADGDRILFQRAYGAASLEYGVPNTVDTRFDTASVGKMFTAVAIGQLVDAGRLSFDDPIGKYLDESWISPSSRNVTIGQLLCHTGGLGSYFNPEFVRSSPRSFKQLGDYRRLVFNDRPAFLPGTQWSYSNTGYLLLGMIVQRVSGEDYFDYVRRHVFEPAGMRDTGALDIERVNPRVAQAYEKFSLKHGKMVTEDFVPAKIGEAVPQNPVGRLEPTVFERGEAIRRRTEQVAAEGFELRNTAFMNVVRGGPAGGFRATAPDLLRFFRALRAGKLVAPATFAAMRAPKGPVAPHWGYGFMVEPDGFGHTGGTAGISASAFSLDSGYTVIVLSNLGDGTALMVRNLVHEKLKLP